MSNETEPLSEKLRRLLDYLADEVDYEEYSHLNAAILARQTFQAMQPAAPQERDTVAPAPAGLDLDEAWKDFQDDIEYQQSVQEHVHVAEREEDVSVFQDLVEAHARICFRAGASGRPTVSETTTEATAAGPLRVEKYLGNWWIFEGGRALALVPRKEDADRLAASSHAPVRGEGTTEVVGYRTGDMIHITNKNFMPLGAASPASTCTDESHIVNEHRSGCLCGFFDGCIAAPRVEAGTCPICKKPGDCLTDEQRASLALGIEELRRGNTRPIHSAQEVERCRAVAAISDQLFHPSEERQKEAVKALHVLSLMAREEIREGSLWSRVIESVHAASIEIEKAYDALHGAMSDRLFTLTLAQLGVSSPETPHNPTTRETKNNPRPADQGEKGIP